MFLANFCYNADMLKIGIVGLPNVGKSTLFNALTKQIVDCANYPFCTIEPNIGIVPVPDERLESLARMSHSEKTIPPVVEFVDIAGLVKGAAEGEGLGNTFLAHIRNVDAIAEVVRVFESKEIAHVSNRINPISDIEVLEYELILKDLETVIKIIETAEKNVKANKKGSEDELRELKEVKEALESGKLASSFIHQNFHLLTEKPIMYIFNASEEQVQNRWKPDEDILSRIKNSPYAVVSAKIESEIGELSAEEQNEFLASLNVSSSGLDRLIKTAYRALCLITFFTTGEKETRGWTIPEDSKAPRAGRAIHSDFEEKFIRAEVIYWAKLIEAGSWARARDLGLLRTEGKEYEVKDGDVIEFKI